MRRYGKLAVDILALGALVGVYLGCRFLLAAYIVRYPSFWRDEPLALVLANIMMGIAASYYRFGRMGWVYALIPATLYESYFVIHYRTAVYFWAMLEYPTQVAGAVIGGFIGARLPHPHQRNP